MNETSTDSAPFGQAGQLPIVTGGSPPSPVAPEDTVAPADQSALQRLDATLDQLDHLSDLLSVDESYLVPPLDFDLPANFKL